MQEQLREQHGFLFLMTLFGLAGLLSLSLVGLTRSVTELTVSTRSVASHQAFQLAESGVERVLEEFTTGGTDGIKENFSLNTVLPTNDNWRTDSTLTPPCTGNCRVQTFPLAGGSVTVRIDDITLASPTINLTGATSTLTTRALQVRITKGSGNFILGTTTLVNEIGKTDGMAPSFYDSRFAQTLKIEGCNGGCPSATRVPGLIVTTPKAMTGFVNYKNSNPPFGSRLVGEGSDLGLPTGQQDYSIHQVPDAASKGPLSYALMNDLAAYVRAEAIKNGCFFDVNNDDTTLNDDPAVPGERAVNLFNRSLGDPSNPKICYVEYHFAKNADGTYKAPNAGKNSVRFLGHTTGAGVLVVHGEFEVQNELSSSESHYPSWYGPANYYTPGFPDTFEYDGLIVALGPSTEFDMQGMTGIHGAVIVGTTEPYCSSPPCPPGTWKWLSPPQFEMEGAGSIQYNQQNVTKALVLLAPKIKAPKPKIDIWYEP